MTIREHAQKVGFKIIGKLTRHPEREWDINYMTGEKYYIVQKFIQMKQEMNTIFLKKVFV